MSRVLFIAKKADYNYSGGDPLRVTGLKLSAAMCVEVLNRAGIAAKLVIVIDNNDIDREVKLYQPTHVILEALWVVPSKFAVLTKLYPKVQWIVRIHSEIPFLSMEGISIEWLLDYVKIDHVYISGNSPNLNAAIKDILNSAYPDQLVNAKNIYLPNCYVVDDIPPREPYIHNLHVGCFGAIRPFKNQLMQAIAAMTYAESIGFRLAFHMNGTRQETGGSAVLKNIVALFENSPRHRLVLHPWMSHADFLKLCAKIHLGMQVSLSESFNIVTADLVTVGVPTVVSPAIYWMPKSFMADPTNLASIVDRLGAAQASAHWWFGRNSAINALNKQATIAARIWTTYFR
jgi:hypothetical protein